jgi:hypothetical protein
LSGYDEDVSLAIVRRLACERKWSAPGGVPSGADFPVRDWFMEMSVSALDLLQNPVTAQQQSIKSEAIRLISEVRSVHWVRDQNFNRSVAPASDAVIEHYAEELGRFGEQKRAESLVASASSSGRNARSKARSWCRTFRRNWSVSNSHLACRESLPLGELKDKAGGIQRKVPHVALGPLVLETTVFQICFVSACGARVA